MGDNNKEVKTEEKKEEMTRIPPMLLKRLKPPPPAKMIDFGPDFEKRSLRDQIKYLKKLSSSLNEACQQIQKERDMAYNFTNKMNEDVKLAIQTRTRDRELIHKQMGSANEKHQKLITENQGLYKEIKKLECKVKKLEAELEALKNDGQH